MKISTKPASLVLVGILIIFFPLSASAELQSNGLEQIDAFKKDPFYYRHHEMSSDWGTLKVGEDTIYFPWYRCQTLPMLSCLSGSTSVFSPKKEEISLDRSNSVANVKGLSAINTLNQRDLRCEDSQNGDPEYQGLVNSLGISVSGEGNDSADKSQAVGREDGFKSMADEDGSMVCQSDGIDGQEFGKNKIHHAGNYLSVDIHDISVSAINTMKGGSAVATSNIIIKPVQIIVCPSEVDVKLK
jgi:hypothetical protein